VPGPTTAGTQTSHWAARAGGGPRLIKPIIVPHKADHCPAREIMQAIDDVEYGLPDGPQNHCEASSAAIWRRWLLGHGAALPAPVRPRKRACDLRSGPTIAACDPALTRLAFSNSATAPRTCRISLALGVSIVKCPGHPLGRLSKMHSWYLPRISRASSVSARTCPFDPASSRYAVDATQSALSDAQWRRW
jgi:hypothetical protein